MTALLEDVIVYLLFLFTNVGQSIVYMNLMMKRRKSLTVLIIYLIAKTIIVNILLKIILADAISSYYVVKNIYSSLVILTGILSYIVMLYTFNEHFAKIAIISTAVDIGASLVGYLSVFITNLISGKEHFAVESPLYPTDFLLPVIAYLFMCIILKVIKRFEIRIKNWELKYKKITMSVFIAYLGYSFYSMFQDFDRNVNWIGAFSAILFSYILVRYVNYYHRTMLWENEMLKKQQVILRMQYKGIVLQSEQIKHLQEEIDNKMLKVMELGRNAENKSEQIHKYIDSLKQKAQNISIGMFCDDKNIDFALYLTAQKCKTKGLEYDFDVQNYIGNEDVSIRLSKDIEEILNKSLNRAKKNISFSLATIKGKVIIKLSVDGKEKVEIWN